MVSAISDSRLGEVTVLVVGKFSPDAHSVVRMRFQTAHLVHSCIRSDLITNTSTVMLTRSTLSSQDQGQGQVHKAKPNTLKAKAIISRPKPLEEKANNKARNDQAKITIVAIMHGNYFSTNVCSMHCLQ